MIACDESGVHGAPHYGFGVLWMKWERRGDFYRDFHELVSRHGLKGECKWSRASNSRHLSFYLALTQYFFRRRWLIFHCLVVRKDIIQKDLYHNGDWDLARRKHFTMLLTNKMNKALRRSSDHTHEFRVWADPIASRYKKAGETVEVISNNILNKEINGSDPVLSVVERDSSSTPQIQLCDLLLGAVMETWQRKVSNVSKQAIRQDIAAHLGWPALDSDTQPYERKFNVWYFHDPVREPRMVDTREVILRYPYP